MNKKSILLMSFNALAVLVVVFFAGSSAYGVYNNYHGVPVWDMWNGYLEFYYRAHTEGWTPWWEQHNEHRLVLAKLIFWIEVHIFKGNLILLFVLNFLFSVLSFITLLQVMRRVLDKQARTAFGLGVMLLAAFCFTWLQQENYTWAFQSQFHMAYLLPLWSFLALAKSREQESKVWFAGALALGFASMVTMANGVLALPLLVCMGVVLRLRASQLIALIALAILALFLYFNNYQKIEFHPSMMDGLKNHLKPSIIYFAKYISGPLYPYVSHHLKLALMVGMLFVLTAAALAWIVVFSGRITSPRRPTLVALLAFVAFIGATAVSTSLGRSVISMDVPSRYMTPALLGWSCMVVLLLYFSQSGRKRLVAMFAAGVPVFLILYPLQFKAAAYTDAPQRYRTAALSLAMDVKDTEFSRILYWNYDRLKEIDSLARADGRSIYSQSYIQHIKAPYSPLRIEQAQPCQFYLDKMTALDGEAAYLRAEGWVYAPVQAIVPFAMYFANPEGLIGYAITGQHRPDVAQMLQAPKATEAGFIGYVLKDELENKPVRIQAIDRYGKELCSLTLN